MNKNTTILGIDISKDVFDVYGTIEGHRQYENNEKGFALLCRDLKPDSWLVMEATGSYHYRLAVFCHDKGIQVSVVNPLVIKRFIQMKLNKVKTDKSDAQMICRYGEEQPLECWKPDPQYIEECKICQGIVQLYFKQRTAVKNKLHSLERKGYKGGKMVASLKRQLRALEKETRLLEQQLEELVKAHEKELYARVKTIPGLGRKTAMLLIVATNGFRDFQSSKQIASYFGLAPHERSSGSSIRGKARIGKNGYPLIRNHLFLCSFTASQYNPQCKALYDRIVGKGKSKKLALIAVSNKLIKQAYGIAKSGLQYDENYKGKLI